MTTDQKYLVVQAKFSRADEAAANYLAALERGFDIGDAEGHFAMRAIEVWAELRAQAAMTPKPEGEAVALPKLDTAKALANAKADLESRLALRRLLEGQLASSICRVRDADPHPLGGGGLKTFDAIPLSVAEDLVDQINRLDRQLGEVIDERDRAQDALQETHLALGGDGEWTLKVPPEEPPHSGDLHDDVPALAKMIAHPPIASPVEVQGAGEYSYTVAGWLSSNGTFYGWPEAAAKDRTAKPVYTRHEARSRQPEQVSEPVAVDKREVVIPQNPSDKRLGGPHAPECKCKRCEEWRKDAQDRIANMFPVPAEQLFNLGKEVKIGADNQRNHASAKGPVEPGAAHPDEHAMLEAIHGHLQRMIYSAEEFSDGEAVTGYKIKTGALHQIVGLFVLAGKPLVIPTGLPQARSPHPAPALPADWQPIKSAPKDGRTILAMLEDGEDTGMVYTIEWRDEMAKEEIKDGKGIGWRHSWDSYLFSGFDGPKYWMPIPPAPKAPPIKPQGGEMSDFVFKCPHCASHYFGPHWAMVDGKYVHAGRQCKGWPTGYDRSYNACPAKYVEMFDAPKAPS